MTKRVYHINEETGEPNRCSSVIGECLLGTTVQHFSTPEEAQDSVSWTFRVTPPKRAASKITLSSVKNDLRRAAVDSLFDSDSSLRAAWRVALKHFDGLCYLCGKPVYDRKTGQEIGVGDMKASADHIITPGQGGITAAGNLAPAHLKCNNARGHTPIEEYLVSNQEMLNRVRNFQKKYRYKPLDKDQLKEINDSFEMIWEGMKAQLVVLKRLI